jgi:hypothetical protein
MINPVSIDVIAVGSFENRVDVILAHHITSFVEGRLDTCYLLQETGIQPILFNQPRNRESRPFVEIGHWEELDGLINFTDTTTDEGQCG